MGVRTELLPNLDCGSQQNDCNNDSEILGTEQFENLVTYLTGLGVRPQRGWESGFEDQSIVRGMPKYEIKLFTLIQIYFYMTWEKVWLIV